MLNCNREVCFLCHRLCVQDSLVINCLLCQSCMTVFVNLKHLMLVLGKIRVSYGQQNLHLLTVTFRLLLLRCSCSCMERAIRMNVPGCSTVWNGRIKLRNAELCFAVFMCITRLNFFFPLNFVSTVNWLVIQEKNVVCRYKLQSKTWYCVEIFKFDLFLLDLNHPSDWW